MVEQPGGRDRRRIHQLRYDAGEKLAVGAGMTSPQWRTQKDDRQGHDSESRITEWMNSSVGVNYRELG